MLPSSQTTHPGNTGGGVNDEGSRLENGANKGGSGRSELE